MIFSFFFFFLFLLSVFLFSFFRFGIRQSTRRIYIYVAGNDELQIVLLFLIFSSFPLQLDKKGRNRKVRYMQIIFSHIFSFQFF